MLNDYVLALDRLHDSRHPLNFDLLGLLSDGLEQDASGSTVIKPPESQQIQHSPPG